MLTFAKRLLFVLLLILIVLFVYQNRGPLSQTTQFSFDLHWWGAQDSAPEGLEDGASEDVPDDGAPESGLRLQTPGQKLQQSGFTLSVGSDHANALSRAHSNAKIADQRPFCVITK